LLLANLAADIAKYAGGQGRGQIAVLILRVEDEIVDDDFGVFGHGQRRLIGEQQLRLAAVSGVDLLVVDNVVADHQLALLPVRRLRGDVGVDLSGDSNLVRLGKSRPAQACGPEGRENNPV
jgi:hypothetical protein